MGSTATNARRRRLERARARAGRRGGGTRLGGDFEKNERHRSNGCFYETPRRRARAEGDGVWMESRSWTESRGVGLCARAMCGRDGDAND